jgi:hypothetical protein
MSDGAMPRTVTFSEIICCGGRSASSANVERSCRTESVLSHPLPAFFRRSLARYPAMSVPIGAVGPSADAIVFSLAM